ncbi:unnamed protein product [Peniophora sp. CBMAI 1063]|nr:unnamed protein product [Peniophora sp. CBMAI 1063]
MEGQHDRSGAYISTPLSQTAHPPPRNDPQPSKVRAARNAYARYEESQDVACLHSAINLYQEAVDTASEPNAATLSWLGHCLNARFEARGKLEDLDLSIEAGRRALELVPDEHPDRAQALCNLSFSLKHRFRRLGIVDDLEMTPTGHPSIPVRLDNLGSLLSLRFEQFGQLDDLNRAISEHQRAVKLAPDGHVDKATRLHNLAVSLIRRFERLRDPEDLERALALGNRVVELTPDGDPDLAVRLGTLCYMQDARFRHLGKLEDIEHAIMGRQRVIELTADTNPDKAMRLHNLASSLLSRFERLGDPEDLERAITMQRRAIDLTPDDHPDKPIRLDNFGHSQFLRYQRHKKLEDLESAVAEQRHAIELTPTGHPEEATRLHNLASYLRRLFERSGDRDDLKKALELQRRAIELTPDDYPGIPVRLDNFGYLHYLRFERFGELDGLKCAVEEQRRAVNLTEDGDMDKETRLHNLGMSLLTCFCREGDADSLREALSCFTTATSYPLLSPVERLNTAKSVVILLNDYPDFSTRADLLLAHSRIVDIVPELVWVGYDLKRRLEESQQLGELISSAVCAAIGAGAVPQAVEWFDVGRALVWTQTLSLRSPLHELEQAHPDLAHALSDVHAQLQSSMSISLHHNMGAAEPREDAQRSQKDRHRGLAIQHGKLLAELRRLPGFEGFMRPRKLSAILQSFTPLSGPVVCINVDRTRCDALIIHPEGTITTLRLSELSLAKAEALRSRWQSYLEQQNVRVRERSSSVRYRKCQLGSDSASRVLDRLWRWVVGPILTALNLVDVVNTANDTMPHVTWCPSGALMQLPLHAAGIYDETAGPRTCNLVVSSYAPSLPALTRSLDSSARQGSTPRILVVTQPDTPGFPPLPGTTVEGLRLRELFDDSETPPTALDGEHATTDAVKRVLGEYSWLHLACHGSQDLNDPLKSAFALYDGPLTLSDLMATTADNADLAFLSACQTAVGDEKISEESMHLAAGMLAVGFKGVVATMWSIRDDDAPLIVEEYYKNLLELRASATSRRGETGAAYALHEAAKRLREEVGEKEFLRWAPFVHFGI